MEIVNIDKENNESGLNICEYINLIQIMLIYKITPKNVNFIINNDSNVFGAIVNKDKVLLKYITSSELTSEINQDMLKDFLIKSRDLIKEPYSLNIVGDKVSITVSNKETNYATIDIEHILPIMYECYTKYLKRLLEK